MLNFNRILYPSKKEKSCFYISLSAAFSLAGYEIIRSSSNSLFKKSWGVEYLPVVYSLLPIIMIGAFYLYNKSLTYFGAKKTLLWSNILSAAFITILFFFVQKENKWSIFLLLIYREVYIVFIIEQMWSFINSILSKQEAKVTNGLILALASCGSLLGNFILVKFTLILGSKLIILLSIFFFIPSIIFINKSFSSFTTTINLKTKEEYSNDTFGMKLMKKEPLLLMILIIIISTQVLSTVVDLNFQKILYDAYPDVDQQTAFSGLFFSYLHAMSLFMQIFLVPFILNFLSLYLIHLLIPTINFIAVFISFLFPSLETCAFALFIFKSFDYSLFRAAKEVLYIPLSFEARFRSKELIDVLGYRISKGGTSLLISLFQKIGIPITYLNLTTTGLAASVIWFFSALPMMRQIYKEKSVNLSNNVLDNKNQSLKKI